MTVKRKKVEEAPTEAVEPIVAPATTLDQYRQRTTPKAYIEIGEALIGLGYVASRNIFLPVHKDGQDLGLLVVIEKLLALALPSLVEVILRDLSGSNSSRVGTMICNGLMLAGG